MTDQPNPLPDRPGYSACWCHFTHERLGRRPFQICGECGHVYRSRWHLIGRYIREVWDYDGPRIFLHLAHLLRRVVRPRRIYFCQECIHDF